MARRYGRAPRGQRVIGSVPHGHWMTSTFIAGLRCDGIIAPCLFDGAINGELFLAYVEQQLAPTLAPDDIVVADNLGSHKVAGVREAIEARGASLWFQPSYSPDLNPIEQVFDCGHWCEGLSASAFCPSTAIQCGAFGTTVEKPPLQRIQSAVPEGTHK